MTVRSRASLSPPRKMRALSLVVLFVSTASLPRVSVAPVSIFSDLDELVEADVVAVWAQAALSWVARSGCKSAACASVQARPAQQIRVLAGAAPQPITVTFLSGNAAFAGASNHGPLDLDAVVVLDPTPGRPYGHPLLVFGVQLNVDEDKCRASHTGYPIAGEGCLHALRPANCKRDECSTILVPPLVTPTGRTPHVAEDILFCRSDILGFAPNDIAPCPVRQRFEDSNMPPCDPLASNTPRCATATPPQARIRCTPGYSCDHAILIYGRWSQQLSPNLPIERVYDRLLQDGFLPEHVATFVGGGDSERPAAHKAAIRNHLRRLCEQPRCIGALFLLAGGVATPDGSILLWDSDQNGRVSDSERYTPQELVKDLSRCQARRVFVMVDHAFADPVVTVANITASAADGMPILSRPLRNVVIMSASSHGPGLTRLWLDSKQESCMDHLIEAAGSIFQGSPSLLGGASTGAPCGRRGKFGCRPFADIDLDSEEIDDNIQPC